MGECHASLTQPDQAQTASLCASAPALSADIQCSVHVGNGRAWLLAPPQRNPDHACMHAGKEHTEFCEGKTQRKLYGRNFSDQEVNEFSVLAMAGAASEAMRFDEV